MAFLSFSANVAGTDVTVLVVEVTADHFPDAFIFNFPVDSGIASGTIEIPAGSDRRILVRAFNADGIETHQGEATVDVFAGANPTVRILLLPLTGDVPIEVIVGSVIVIVTPDSLILQPGDRAALTARAEDSDGNSVVGSVVWGSSDPFVAAVDDSGLVRAVAPGFATIAANIGTAAGHALVIVVTGETIVSTGLDHTCALIDNRALCWGRNDFGQLGNGTTAPSTQPVAVAGGHLFKAIDAGSFHTCAIDLLDRAWCWAIS